MAPSKSPCNVEKEKSILVETSNDANIDLEVGLNALSFSKGSSNPETYSPRSPGSFDEKKPQRKPAGRFGEENDEEASTLPSSRHKTKAEDGFREHDPAIGFYPVIADMPEINADVHDDRSFSDIKEHCDDCIQTPRAGVYSDTERNVEDEPALEYAATISPSGEIVPRESTEVARVAIDQATGKPPASEAVEKHGLSTVARLSESSTDVARMPSELEEVTFNKTQSVERQLGESQGRNTQNLQPGAVRVWGVHGEEDSTLTSVPVSVQGNHSASPYVLSAQRVEEPTLAQATALPNNWLLRQKTKTLLLLSGLVILVLAVIIGLSVGLTRNGGSDSGFVIPTPSPAPTDPPLPTLESVRNAGVLRCGVNTERAGLSTVNAEGEREGFEIDLCRAVAAAVLGDSYRIETILVPLSDRFIGLAKRSVDLVVRVTTHTMERDVYRAEANTGFSFSIPYLYEGLSFGGIPAFVSCADNLAGGNGTAQDCADLRVCTLGKSTHLDILRDRLPGSNIVEINQAETTRLQEFLNGECNVIAGARHDISPSVVAAAGYMGPYAVGSKLLSKEPSSMMTRDNDPQWSDFVNWVLHALLAAEEQGITQDTANSFVTTSVFGDNFENMFINAISAVGNYGEMYQRNLELIVPRPVLNTVNTDGQSGVLYSFPFGKVSSRGPVQAGGTLENVKARGHLRCGITRRPGFGDNSTGDWLGLDADYCRAVSAGIFSNTLAPIEFVEVPENVTLRFDALASGEVDVLSGSAVTLESDVLEPTLGEGFAFSQPYFYNNQRSQGIPPIALATRQDDAQWSPFVYWIVTCTFYAEEQGITQMANLVSELPLVDLFGSGIERRMFRDAILAVGNYGEMYQRNLESLIPRAGYNLVNLDPFGPQHYPLFL